MGYLSCVVCHCYCCLSWPVENRQILNLNEAFLVKGQIKKYNVWEHYKHIIFDTLSILSGCESLSGSAAAEHTCNQEHDSSNHSYCGFELSFAVHEAGALHSHSGDHQRHKGEEDADQHHGPGSLDLS